VKPRQTTWTKVSQICVLGGLLLSNLLSPLARVQASTNPGQTVTPVGQATALLNELTPEERIGQLFLVTFQGTDVGNGTQIQDLIANHHIGGVILLSANNNFVYGENSLLQILVMNRQLQLDRWTASQQTQVNKTTGEAYQPAFLPLLIGISQEGDGAPYDQIINGMTQLPNEMAMGATWNPDLVSQAGTVLGSELRALGINLLLGPSLDVVETPHPESGSDLGTRSFGGDPFWVGVMGRAYTTGIHTGSGGRVAVAAKNFPGAGSSDRLPEDEVATVRKSLEQLKNYDLAPFFAVTGNSPAISSTVDALLTSHIRYQGFQGDNIRATTRPVSFDAQTLSLLMGLPALSTWRNDGGLMISDSLGSRAVRRFYELASQTFDAPRVALNAFLAGNDLLYLGDITAGDDPDAYTTTLRILDFFTQKYREDPVFAQRVDESALRILTLKFRMYPQFNLTTILPPLDGVGTIGKSSQVTFDLARQAATLISPSLTELDNALAENPNQSDRIVFITDSRVASQCSTCPEQPIIAVNALQQAVLRLYGPQSGKQVLTSNLSSYSFQELLGMLDGTEKNLPIEADIRRANWLVFAMLNVTSDVPSSMALKRFLAERPTLLQQKRLIVFAFNAPYYLDATDISKVTAYFALYSKTARFVEVAARLLFGEIRPTGALPISVSGIGYNLITATSPNPNQVIPLTLDIPTPAVPQDTLTPEATPVPEIRVGNLIPVRTGVILDHNGRPVPDGTEVQFIVTYSGQNSPAPQTTTTVNGVARMMVQVTLPGALEIRVTSDPATKSEVLHFDIPPTNGEAGTATPTLEPTVTPQPSPTVTIAPVAPPESQAPPPQRPNMVDWMVAILLATAIGTTFYRLAAYLGNIRLGVRGGFMALIGGLCAYSYLALRLPGSLSLLTVTGGWGILLTTLLGSLLGIGIAWVWRTLQTRLVIEK
jgi:beta-N-acetylhexosaminidase